MTLKCHVSLLDGSEADFEIGGNAKASKLLDEVCKHLNIVEKHYFGLIYKGSDLQNAWLTLDKKIKKQIHKKGKIEFEFVVKFYPTDPTKLREEITRYQVCLQVRKDLAGNLSCSVDKLTLLLSHWLQSEYEGKNDNAKAVKECLKDFQNHPKEVSSAEFIDRVLTLYRERRDMLSADADNQFLITASGLRLYGVHFYKGRETAGNDILIGIGAKGVIEKREGQVPVFHSWSRIKNIVYKNNKFKLKLSRAPTNGDPRLKKSFLYDSEAQVHAIWQSAVDHHVFFRVGEKDIKHADSTKKPKKKKSILRRFSSKKKNPKTETDVQEEAKGISRRPPTVTRASSLRRSASLRMSTSSESSPSVEHQVGVLAPTPGGETYSVSREPQMDSEASSEAESTKPNKTEVKEVTPALANTTVLPPSHAHAQKVEDEQHYDGREYIEEDLMEAVIGKLDGTTSRGSSTLLLTETIPEEDEEEHHDALPSPRKRVRPKHFAPLRDGILRTNVGSFPDDGGSVHEKGSRRMETELDADVVLSPGPPGIKVKDAFDLEAPVGEDARHLERHRIILEHTEVTEEYTEVWEDVQVKPTQQHPKIRIVQNEEKTINERQVGENPIHTVERKPKDPSSSSSSRTSSQEEQIKVNSQGEQQMQKFRDALPSPRKRVLSTPKHLSPPRDGELRIHQGSTPDDGGFSREQVSRPLETGLVAEVMLSTGLPGSEDTDAFALEDPIGKDVRHLERHRFLPEHTSEEYIVNVEPIQQPRKLEFKQVEEKISERNKRKPKDYSVSSSSRTSSEEEEIRFNSQGENQMEELPENEILKVQDIPLPIFDDLDQSIVYQEENVDEHVTTIKDYIPRIGKESTEDETDEEDNGEFIIDSGKEIPMRKIDLNDLPQESENIDDLMLQGHGSDDDIETEGEFSSSQPSTRKDLSLFPDQPFNYLSRGREDLGKEDESIEEEYEDDFEEDTPEEGAKEDDNLYKQPQSKQPIEHEVDEKRPVDKDEPSSPKTVPVKDDNLNQTPISTVPRELTYRSPTHGVSINFRTGGNYKLTPPAKSGKRDKISNGAASTTGATIGDEDEFALDELDAEILYEEEHPRKKEQIVDYHLSDEEDDKEAEAKGSQPSPPGQFDSRSTSLSDITDDTDELLEPNILEKAWSQGAGLDEDDELFQILFRTPPRRRKHRNRSEINPRDVRKGKHEAIAFRTNIDEEPVSPRRRDKLSRRPFIPSWPFDPMSLLDSRDLGILDKEAIKAALSAQRELIDEANRLEDIEMMEDVEMYFPEDEDAKYQPSSREILEKPEKLSRSEKFSPSLSEKDVEFLGARSRSPSASPRMVGEEFIPGVPDFVHSVIPYQLETPSDYGELEQDSGDASPIPDVKESVDPEFMTFPQPIMKFPCPSKNTDPLSYRYSTPAGIKALPVAQCQSSAEETEIMTFATVAIQGNTQSRDCAQLATSSGRSTPQSAAGNTSQSEGKNSSNSKSSSSSFPRFIHSVFPLRRSSSSDRRGRSKTRKKREKKITKQKSKKKARSKSKEKKNTGKTVPAIEITSPADVSGFAAISTPPSPPHYSMFFRQIPSNQVSQEHQNASKLAGKEQQTSNGIGVSRSQYDQESLDKIILSESDDAHSDSGTPDTVRRADGFSDIVQERSIESNNLHQQ